jgi:hypothetical protein
MYLTRETVLLNSPSYICLQTIEPYAEISVYGWDNVENKILFKYEQVSGLYNSLYINQFSVDVEKGIFYFNPSNINTYVRIEYYTSGDQNPFHISSNLMSYVTRIIQWSNSRIVDGLYFYKGEFDSQEVFRLKGGSILYNGSLYVCKDLIMDFKDLASPTINNVFRCYYFFINEEILSNYLDEQTLILNSVGEIHSQMLYDTMRDAKNDVDKLYNDKYFSDPLGIAYVYLRITGRNYNFWINYVNDSRVL